MCVACGVGKNTLKSMGPPTTAPLVPGVNFNNGIGLFTHLEENEMQNHQMLASGLGGVLNAAII